MSDPNWNDLSPTEKFRQAHAEIDRLRVELAAMCENHQAAVAHYRACNKELAEAKAALKAANARIAELEASPRESFFWPVERVRSELCLAVARAERAEAECKAMREALDIVMPTLEYYHKGSTALAKARAALNYSSVDKAVDTKDSVSYIIFKGD